MAMVKSQSWTFEFWVRLSQSELSTMQPIISQDLAAHDLSLRTRHAEVKLQLTTARGRRGEMRETIKMCETRIEALAAAAREDKGAMEKLRRDTVLAKIQDLERGCLLPLGGYK